MKLRWSSMDERDLLAEKLMTEAAVTIFKLLPLKRALGLLLNG